MSTIPTERGRTFKQTLQDITETLYLPPNTRAKLINVEIKSKHLKVTHKITGEVLLNGELFAEIIDDESTWWVEDEKELNVTLEKRKKQEWWPHVLVTDPKIDVKKIPPEQSSLSDLDPETRAHVEKMVFDQRQNQMGLPSSDELQKHKILDKFKAMHPELDFSQVNEKNINM